MRVYLWASFLRELFRNALFATDGLPVVDSIEIKMSCKDHNFEDFCIILSLPAA